MTLYKARIQSICNRNVCQVKITSTKQHGYRVYDSNRNCCIYISVCYIAFIGRAEVEILPQINLTNKNKISLVLSLPFQSVNFLTFLALHKSLTLSRIRNHESAQKGLFSTIFFFDLIFTHLPKIINNNLLIY